MISFDLSFCSPPIVAVAGLAAFDGDPICVQGDGPSSTHCFQPSPWDVCVCVWSQVMVTTGRDRSL